MKHKYVVPLAVLALSASSVTAQILYDQNFDSLASSSGSAANIGGYGVVDNIGGIGWQVQGGTDSGAGGIIQLTAGINANGVGGSQALFGTWDTTTGANWMWNQYSYYGVGAAGPGRTLADITISLDLYMSGSSSATPITVQALQDGGNTAMSYTPTLTDGQYTSVSFSLAQATASGTVPFDPTAAFWFRVSHGNGGFGFDNPNTVQIDNVLITAVPEPSLLALAGLGAATLLGLRRRKA
jgi:hypothetical protein